MKSRSLRFTGPLADLSAEARRLLLDRRTSSDERIQTITAATLDLVRREGDSALRSLAREYDSVRLTAIEVPRDAWRAALDALDPDVRTALEHSAANIRAAHEPLMPRATEVVVEDGVIIGRRPDPLSRVGVYAPGGRASYASSVLMAVIPARMAGVGEVIVCSPPSENGAPRAAVLAAAELAGADRVFAIGGASAIAALAYGTESVPRVDRIVGPGNAFVAEAKVQVAGVVSIDAPAGPGELLVLADLSAEPEAVAREMVAQAEQDTRASAVTVAIGEGMAERIIAALARLVAGVPRKDVVAASLADFGGVLTADSLDEAIAFAGEFAPERLLLAIADARAALPDVRNAGTVLVGATASLALSDHMTGANAVLPTGGLARSYSGLSMSDFVRWTTYQIVDNAAAARLAGDAATIAQAEGLAAQAAAAWALIIDR